MKLRISKGGQVSIPARIRRRWDTDTLVADDLGDRLVIRPVPPDPIGAARGVFRSSQATADEARRRLRQEELEAEARKQRR